MKATSNVKASKKRMRRRSSAIPLPFGRPSVEERDVAAISGSIAGAAVGALAGPPGMIAGSILGAAAGMVAGAALEREHERASMHDQLLDREIGVTEGDLGAAPPGQPPARIGAFSTGSAGAAPAHTTPSDGPMSSLDEDD